MQKVWNKLVESLYTYCKSSGLSDVVFGLSGGIDSALVAVLACEALGKDRVHAIVMPSRYSSRLSIEITEKMQSIHGFDIRTFDIQPVTDELLFSAKQLFKGEAPNQSAKDNLQARIRGPIILGLMCNQYNYLPLCCGNKSEALLGYATFGGDTFGGFAPIGDVYKTQVYELSRWRNSRTTAFPEEVITRAPSAELHDMQTDEESLAVTYVQADAILAMLEMNKSKQEILGLNIAEETTVNHVIDLVHRNSFKRFCLPLSPKSAIPLAQKVQKLLPYEAVQEYNAKLGV